MYDGIIKKVEKQKAIVKYIIKWGNKWIDFKNNPHSYNCTSKRYWEKRNK